MAIGKQHALLIYFAVAAVLSYVPKDWWCFIQQYLNEVSGRSH